MHVSLMRCSETAYFSSTCTRFFFIFFSPLKKKCVFFAYVSEFLPIFVCRSSTRCKKCKFFFWDVPDLNGVLTHFSCFLRGHASSIAVFFSGSADGVLRFELFLTHISCFLGGHANWITVFFLVLLTVFCGLLGARCTYIYQSDEFGGVLRLQLVRLPSLLLDFNLLLSRSVEISAPSEPTSGRNSVCFARACPAHS